MAMGRRNILVLTGLVAACGLVAVVSAPADGQRRRPSLAPVPDDRPPLPANETQCNYQEPIDYLVRENFLPVWTQPPEEQRRRRGLQKQVVRFRTEQYGYFEGFGRPAWNEHPPMHYAKRVRFMDLPIRIHEKIIPALECVEQQLRAECGDTYEPRRLSGIRASNSYHNGQVSNHVYGIAVDVDPRLNTCCRCVAQWQDHPLCQQDVESIYERMAMPACWVHVFERFGFYWLGRDALQDTMHFEFLGDPAHILKSTGQPPHMEGRPMGPTEPEGAAPRDTASESETERAETEPESAAATNETEPQSTESEGSMSASEQAAESSVPSGAPPRTGGCSCTAAGV